MATFNPAVSTAPTTQRDWVPWIGAMLGLVLFCLIAYTQRERFLPGRNDFLQLYAGARLSGTPQLYDADASKKVGMQALGMWLEGVYYARLPFYAFLLRPLGKLPYPVAYWLFEALSFSAFAVFLWIWARRCPELMLFASLCLAVLANFMQGQDLAFVLLAAALAVECLRRGRDFTAGLLFSICAIKVHLFVLIPLVLLVHRRWRVLGGGAAGSAVLLGISFASDGWDWPRRYLGFVTNPESHPLPGSMPNLRGLFFGLLGRDVPVALIAVSVLVAAAVVWIAWRSGLDFALAIALAGGLLIGIHAYLQDCMILLLVFVLVLEQSRWAPLRSVTALTITPPVLLCLMVGSPWNVVVPLALLALVGLAVVSVAFGLNDRAPAR